MPAALLAFFGSSLFKVFTDAVIKWIAFKALMIFLFVTIVPIVLNNCLADIIQLVGDYAGSASSGASSFGGSMNLTDFMGWLADCLKLRECLAVVVSALQLRIVLSMIPFVRI